MAGSSLRRISLIGVSTAAGEKFAKSDADRAWFAADRKLREMITIRDFGVWAHYVGDASQPLHVSVHYDVWGDYPNPEGFNTVKGLHFRFEGPFVRANIVEADVTPLMVALSRLRLRHRSPYGGLSRRDAIPCPGAFPHGEEFIDFEGANPDGKAFAAARLAAGVDELRDMTIDAWHASGNAKIGFKGIAVKDAEAGHIDGALAELQGDD